MAGFGARKEAIWTAVDEQGRAQEYRALFTNRALAEAESAAGKSITVMMTGFASGRSGVTEVAALLRAGLEAARRESGAEGKPVTLDEAYDVLDRMGVNVISEQLGQAIGAVLSYGVDKEPKKTSAEEADTAEKNA